jgi:NitT/TauT family transport system substrate-binding protein
MSAVARAVSACLLAGVLLVAVAACGSSDDPDEEVAVPGEPESGEFEMGVVSWIGYGPWYVAEDQGFFTEQGLDGVEITNFATDRERDAALAGGRAQAANVAGHTALIMAEAGLPIKIVLLEDVSLEADAIIAGPGIDSVADLAGKKVAYEEGATSDILLRYALSQEGMTIEDDDIEVVPLPASDAGAAAIAGRVDAAVTYEPYISQAVAEDSGFKVLYTAAEKPGLISDVFVVPDDVVAERPGQIDALLRAWDQGVSQYRTDTAATQQVIADGIGAGDLPAADLEAQFDGVEFYDTQESAEALNGEYRETLEEIKTVATDAGLIQGTVDVDDLIDPQFVDAVANE